MFRFARTAQLRNEGCLHRAQRHGEGFRAEKFGADLAFHDMGEMVAHPDVDLVTVVVRVPWHKDLVMQAIDAKKPVCCERPLGAHVAEAAWRWRTPHRERRRRQFGRPSGAKRPGGYVRPRHRR